MEIHDMWFFPAIVAFLWLFFWRQHQINLGGKSWITWRRIVVAPVLFLVAGLILSRVG